MSFKPTKNNIRMSFTEWFKYIHNERIVNDTKGYRNELHHNTMCLLHNKKHTEFIFIHQN